MKIDIKKNPIWKMRSSNKQDKDRQRKWKSKKCLERSSSEDSHQSFVARTEEVKELTVGDIEGPSYGKHSDTELKIKKKKGKFLDLHKSKIFFDHPKAREDEKQLKKLLGNQQIYH